MWERSIASSYLWLSGTSSRLPSRHSTDRVTDMAMDGRSQNVRADPTRHWGSRLGDNVFAGGVLDRPIGSGAAEEGWLN